MKFTRVKPLNERLMSMTICFVQTARSRKALSRGVYCSDLQRHWLNILAVCATVLGISSTIYFVFYTNRMEASPPPIVFGRNYGSDTCKLSISWFYGFSMFASSAPIKSHSQSRDRQSDLKVSFHESIFYSSQPGRTLCHRERAMGRVEPLEAARHEATEASDKIRCCGTYGSSDEALLQRLYVLG